MYPLHAFSTKKPTKEENERARKIMDKDLLPLKAGELTLGKNTSPTREIAKIEKRAPKPYGVGSGPDSTNMGQLGAGKPYREKGPAE